LMKQTGNRVCLLLHGFTGGPYEVEPLARALEEAGWYCRVPRLPGHDEGLAGLCDTTCDMWLEAACREAEQLGQEYGAFDLAGFSMGGMLGIHLAARYPVRKLALLSAAAIYVSPGRMVRNMWHTRHEERSVLQFKLKQTPTKAVLQFMRLVHRVRPDISRVAVPALVVQGLRDPIVHPVSARYLTKRLPCVAETVYFPRSRHLLCLEEEASDVICKVKEFFET
jgi:carboxylesterase